LISKTQIQIFAINYQLSTLNYQLFYPMSKPTLRIVVHLIAFPDKVEELKSLLLSIIEPTRREPGCIKYELLQNQADPTDFTFVEEWESTAWLELHLASTHIQAAVLKLEGVAVAPPDIRRYQLLES
jgi:quinol monooxygenase YgiN